MIDWIIEAFQWLWGWFTEIMMTTAEAVWSGVLPTIPITTGSPLEPFWDVLTIANQYVPVAEAVVAIGIYWTFLAAFITAKMVLKLIPFIG